MADPAPNLAAAWSALKRAEWGEARDSFAAHLEQHPDDPEALDGLGRALWWLGENQEGIERRRQAYGSFRRRGDDMSAANLAIYLAAEHRIAGDEGAASGWLSRAERLLGEEAACAERGWLEVELAKRAAAMPEQRAAHAEAGAEIARGLADPDLEAAALSQLGLAQIDGGETEAGLKVLDEAMAIAIGGEASDPLAIGDACCTTLVACDRLADFEHAADWCRVVVEFTGRHGYTPMQPWCRTIYAGVLIATGDWERAEQELLEAIRAYDELGSQGRTFSVGRLAYLRLLQGRLGEAETLLAGYEDHPQTAVASVLLALARGRTELAVALAERRLDAAGADQAVLAGLLPVCAQAQLAAGDLEAASAAVDRMRELGEELERPNLIALAQLGTAQIAAAREDPDSARPQLELAMTAFGELEMPLEEGRARLELARLERGELALMHTRGAMTAFERLGARPDADAAAALARELGGSGRSAPRLEGELTAREREVLELLAEGLSNPEIADRLVISPKTAEHHVGRILGKLGLRSRAEAAAHAVRGDSPAG